MNILKRFFKTRPYIVWHQTAPDVKLVVFRNKLHDLIYPYDETGGSEKYYQDGYHVAIDRTKPVME